MAHDGEWQAMYVDGQRLLRESAFHEALTCFERAVLLAPQRMEPRREMATTLFQLGRIAEALREFEELTRQFPGVSEAANNLATVLVAAGAFERAFLAAQRALELNPGNVVAMHNLAEVLKHLGDWEAGREIYAAALQIDPNQPTARMQYGMTQVALGDWRAGWTAFEARIEALGPEVLFPETLSSPRWNGTDSLVGQRLLIQHEQGLGDSIMMSRFAGQLSRLGARVHLRCPAPLVELLGSIAGLESCTAIGSPLPQHDKHAPLMSLPMLLRVSPEEMDGGTYLTPYGACPEPIAALLPQDGMPTVALTWSGNPLHINDHRRSIRGDLLGPLLDVPGVRFVAMQKMPPMAELIAPDLQARMIDVGAACGSFDDSAHALRRIDLVVSVDTSVAHLAGALGIRTLLCLPSYPDFRWGLHGGRTPWYSAMTILRQQEPSDWTGVMSDVITHVKRLRDGLDDA